MRLLCSTLLLHFECPELSKTETGLILANILQNMVGRIVLSPWQLNLELGTVCVVDLIPICAPDFLKVFGYPCSKESAWPEHEPVDSRGVHATLTLYE